VYEVAVQTVSQLTRYLREVLTSDPFLRDLWVTGEASNCTTSQAGHTYFTLKDADAQVRCVMFKGGQGGEHVQNGTALIVHGHVSIYEARGALQMVTDMAVPEGVGVLQAQFEALKKRLEEEGLFEPTRKRPLPEFPRRPALSFTTSAMFWNVATRWSKCCWHPRRCRATKPHRQS
jgi:exodeoxyribonuclease VII large subunit